MTSAAVARPDVSVFRATPADMAGAWGRAVGELPGSHLAHEMTWIEVIRRAYGHEPLYLGAEDDDGQVGFLPAFIVRRPVLGTIVTSMPFLDAGGPCSSSPSLADALVARLIDESRAVGARAVELRCTQPLRLGVRPMEGKVTLTLSLPADPDLLWRQLPKSIRSRVRRATRSGLSVTLGGVENLAPFYDVFAARMRDLGSPVHALAFLRAVLDGFGQRAWIALVRKDDAVVGGLVAIGFKDTLVVPWASCRKEFFPLDPNALLYWKTLEMACAQGFRRFDFGRSSRNSGTYHFKSHWGSRDEPLFWYTIPSSGQGGGDRPTPGRGAALLTRSWRHLPLTVTRHLGPHIRKYLTQ